MNCVNLQAIILENVLGIARVLPEVTALLGEVPGYSLDYRVLDPQLVDNWVCCFLFPFAIGFACKTCQWLCCFKVPLWRMQQPSQILLCDDPGGCAAKPTGGHCDGHHRATPSGSWQHSWMVWTLIEPKWQLINTSRCTFRKDMLLQNSSQYVEERVLKRKAWMVCFSCHG